MRNKDLHPTAAEKIAAAGLSVTTLAQASADLRDRFKDIVLQLTPELDNEKGDGPDGTWQWVLDNEPTFATGGPHATFIFEGTGEIVATCTFSPDDRGSLKKNNLDGLGIWGFVNVLQRDLRGSGIGSLVMQYLDEHIQGWVNQNGQPEDVYLFTESPETYQRFGFEALDVQVPFLGHDETLMKKTYQPAA